MMGAYADVKGTRTTQNLGSSLGVPVYTQLQFNQIQGTTIIKEINHQGSYLEVDAGKWPVTMLQVR